jgi:hypothetical protein
MLLLVEEIHMLAAKQTLLSLGGGNEQNFPNVECRMLVENTGIFCPAGKIQFP